MCLLPEREEAEKIRRKIEKLREAKAGTLRRVLARSRMWWKSATAQAKMKVDVVRCFIEATLKHR